MSVGLFGRRNKQTGPPQEPKGQAEGKPSTEPEMVLCIPGTWQSHSDLINGLITQDSGYIFAGRVLADLHTNAHFELVLEPRDERMYSAFQLAGLSSPLPEGFLDDIAGHASVAYIVSLDEPGEASALALARAGNAVARAGGIGVKVESAGKVHTATQWNELLTGSGGPRLYPMYVIDTLRSDERAASLSCGMQNFGLRDTIVYGENAQIGSELVALFNTYQLMDKPSIVDRQTFAAGPNESVWTISTEPHPPYEGKSLFHNPQGMWRLDPLR